MCGVRRGAHSIRVSDESVAMLSADDAGINDRSEDGTDELRQSVLSVKQVYTLSNETYLKLSLSLSSLNCSHNSNTALFKLVEVACSCGNSIKACVRLLEVGTLLIAVDAAATTSHMLQPCHHIPHMQQPLLPSSLPWPAMTPPVP